MGAKLDRVIDALERSINRLPEAHSAAVCISRFHWDPYFREYMTSADVYHYPGQRYEHHRRQLTLGQLDLTG
jgi:hypothetical protein